MARKRFSAEEALAYIDSDASEELDSDELEDSESLDGDREIADYTNSQGEEEVVSYSVLSSTVLVQGETEPACQDSMLLLDSDLDEPSSDSDMEVDTPEVIPTSDESPSVDDTGESGSEHDESGGESNESDSGDRSRGRGRGTGRGRGRGGGRGRGRGGGRGQPTKERILRQRLIVPNVQFIYVMVHALKDITHCLDIEFCYDELLWLKVCDNYCCYGNKNSTKM